MPYLSRVPHRIADHLNTAEVNACRHLLRNQRPSIGERLARPELLEQHKDQHIEPDEKIVNERDYLDITVVIADREHNLTLAWSGE